MNRNIIEAALPFSTKELYARNRNKSGYNVYKSWFYHDWSTLCRDAKKELLVEHRVHTEEEYDEDDSIKSDPAITTQDVLRICARYWQSQPNYIKEAWRNRANLVNALPILGTFLHVPNSVTNYHIILSLTKEFDRWLNTCHHIIKTKKVLKDGDAIKRKRFGKEVILLYTKEYKAFFVSHLLTISLFGSDYSRFVQKNEIVYRTKASVVVHLFQYDRIIDLFTNNGVCLLVWNKNEESIVTAGAKVIVRERGIDGREGIGFVREETDDGKLIVLLENDDEIVVKKPTYNSKNGRWLYHHNDEGEYGIIECHPVRLKLMSSGYIHICFYKFTLNDDKSKILNLH